MSRAWIAFGGNLGDREVLFSSAVAGFEADGESRPVRSSAVYETEAVGPGEQDPYWNAVLEIETRRSPESLLDFCLSLEARLGRVRGERWGPRLIDLDLLLFEDLVIREENLQVPHPRLTERSFVLLPLADLVPDRKVGGRTVSEWLDRCGAVAVKRIRETLGEWP